MTTLATDSPRTYVKGDFNDLPMIAADIIYEGAAVGDNASGYARPLAAGDAFRGFAWRKVDNASGSAGDKNIRVVRAGRIKLAVASAAITDNGKAVYASDDNTFVLTESTNSYVGRITRFISTGVVEVAFDADGPPLADIPLLTDSSGGTASGTIAAIGATYDQAEVRNAVASLAARINTIARMATGI